MPTPGFTTGTSTYYVEIGGIDTPLQIKSVAEVSYEAKVAGNASPIATVFSGGKFSTERQTTSGGYESNPSVTIEVFMCDHEQSASYQLYKWFKACLPASDGGDANWAENRFEMSIVVYDADGQVEVMRWNLDRGWPKNYSISDADVTGGELAVETFELVAEHIDKVVAAKSNPTGRISDMQPVTSATAF